MYNHLRETALLVWALVRNYYNILCKNCIEAIIMTQKTFFLGSLGSRIDSIISWRNTDTAI